jgi:hypothetical protein
MIYGEYGDRDQDFRRANTRTPVEAAGLAINRPLHPPDRMSQLDAHGSNLRQAECYQDPATY